MLDLLRLCGLWRRKRLRIVLKSQVMNYLVLPVDCLNFPSFYSVHSLLSNLFKSEFKFFSLLVFSEVALSFCIGYGWSFEIRK
jgi:hypothetical protein